MHLLPKIVARLGQKVQEMAFSGEVVTAVPLSTAELNKIETACKKRLQREVKLQNRVDPAILGGLIIKFHDLVIDESLRRKLKRLQEKAYEF